MNTPGTNTGHGHVWPRPDGIRARCGGPGLCDECATDAWEHRPTTPHAGATVTPGHIAYQAFATALRQHTPGTTTARWAELSPHLRAAWEQAAREVVSRAWPAETLSPAPAEGGEG